MTKSFQSPIYIFLIAIVSIITFSCVATQKAATYKQVSAENKNVYVQSLDSLDKADSVRNAKFTNGKLDNLSNEKIEHYIDSLRKVSMNRLKDDSIMNKVKISHKNIEFVLAKAYRIAQEAKTHLDNVKLINELLSTNTFTQLNMSSLFESGQYVLKGDYKQKAIESFEPIVKDLLRFAEKFPDKKLSATIVVIGYADAQPISSESELSAVLLDKLNKSVATNPELNKELSRLRAGSATIAIRQIITTEKNASDKLNKLSVEMLPQGRGEELPNPSVRDYKTDDERRRVVNVYWSLLPVLF